MQEKQDRDPGGRADDRWDGAREGRGGPEDGGGRPDEPERADRHRGGPGVTERYHPDRQRQDGHRGRDATKEGDLVVLAEGRDREALEPLRRQVDERAADREQGRRRRAGDARHEMADREGRRGREQARECGGDHATARAERGRPVRCRRVFEGFHDR